MRLTIAHFEEGLIGLLSFLSLSAIRIGGITLFALAFWSGFNAFSQAFIHFLTMADQELRMALPYLGG